MFKRFLEWLRNRKIVRKRKAGVILKKVKPIRLNIQVLPPYNNTWMECYFFGVDPNSDPDIIKELIWRTEVFSQNVIKYALDTHNFNLHKLETVKMIFVPNRFKCKYHGWCGGVYETAFKDKPDKATRYIMCSMYTGKRFKGYKNFVFWEHELGHMFGVFGKKHSINTTLFNKGI